MSTSPGPFPPLNCRRVADISMTSNCEIFFPLRKRGQERRKKNGVREREKSKEGERGKGKENV